VEIDGRSHDDEEQVLYDAERTKQLLSLGWRELRVSDEDVLSDARAVVARIAAMLARKC
jgi:very-short-patch-repair endonuclease